MPFCIDKIYKILVRQSSTKYSKNELHTTVSTNLAAPVPAADKATKVNTTT